MVDRVTVIHGDCIEVMRGMSDSSIDSIVTDPPYGLGFMGKEWDALPPGENWARECLRILKPGGHLLAFGGTRTWHRLAVAVEDAGFEIRDSLAWMHGQGFPKGKSQMKPAFEPVVMARKRTIAPRTGYLSIDAARIGMDEAERAIVDARSGAGESTEGWGNIGVRASGERFKSHAAGRWPANVMLDEFTAEGLDASRFFYVAKASTKERPEVGGVRHPTVKPLALMRWLVRLVTPAGGTVLDPFAGSGTTLEAAMQEGFNVIGIEREAEYLPLIQHRISRQEGELT